MFSTPQESVSALTRTSDEDKKASKNELATLAIPDREGTPQRRRAQ
jgi:hypothetical protein